MEHTVYQLCPHYMKNEKQGKKKNWKFCASVLLNCYHLHVHDPENVNVCLLILIAGIVASLSPCIVIQTTCITLKVAYHEC